MDNAADRISLKRKQKEEKFIGDRDASDLKMILKTEYGRRYIWKQLSRCGVFEISFTGNSTTFFNEGKRDIGLKMLADINEADDMALVLMMREAKEEDNKTGD